jgi:phosphonate transport system permease protein
MLTAGRLGAFFHFMGQFFPPDLSWHYLSYLGTPIAETLGMAAGSIFIAIVIAIPLGLVIGTRMRGSGLLYTVLAAIRSIPDLTLAIFCVILVGIGRGAGLVTLTIYYAAAMAKVFGEIFLAADPRPLDALRATGASKVSLAAFGLIPLKLNDTFTYGIYELESAMRASVIVGAVGAGGIGTELVGSLNAFDYPRITTLILILVTLILFVDRFCWLVRRHPATLLVLPPAGIVSVVFCRPRLFAARHALDTFSKMLPPHLSAAQWHHVPMLIIETLGIAAAGSLCAAFFAVLISPVAARGIAPQLVAVCVKRVFDFARAVPEIVWGLLFVTFVVGGPLAGIIALGLHSFGVLGKLFAESLENVSVDPIRALEATGASRVAVAAFGNYPLAFGPIVVHALFRFEWNVRAATVLGLIGAGGIGEALFNAQEMFFYPQMLAYVLLTCALIGVLDYLSTRLRRRYHVSWEAIE